MKAYLFIISLLLLGCTKAVFKSKWVNEVSPPKYAAKFETSKGDFEIEVTREWSPKAADRLYQLLQHHYFDNQLFYRVVPEFVVQFGNSDTIKSSNWKNFKVADEKVIYNNTKGSISFARAGKETRGTDLFINLNDNLFLDTLNYNDVTGFPAFGNVTAGMKIVESLYSGYGDSTMDKLDSLSINRVQFLKEFPNLDFIKKAYLLKPKR